MIDRKSFFDAVRGTQFGGHLEATQVAGMTAILDAWDAAYGKCDPRWLGYMLATAWWETAKTMLPIAEYGKGQGRKYGVPEANGKVYYGRGLVQLTWLANYEKMGKLLGVDLVNDPDLALDAHVASGIMFEGMIRGVFTGRSLKDYFTTGGSDSVSARRIINGTDHAADIAVAYKHFFDAVTVSLRADPPPATVAVAATPTVFASVIEWLKSVV